MDQEGKVPLEVKRVEQTLGQNLDERIKRLRQALEAAVVTRAKAEHLQMLDYPMSFIYQLTAF